MKVEFENTPEDFAALPKAFPLRLRIWWRVYWIVAGVICCLPATVLLAALGIWYGLAAGWATVGLLCLCVMFLMWRANRRAKANVDPRYLYPTTMTISPERLDVQSDRGWSRRDWSTVDRVHASSQHISIFATKSTAFVVPRRAFESGVAAEQFAQTAIQYHKRAQDFDKPTFSPPAASDLPSDDQAVRIQYANTPEEFIRIRYHGLKKPEQPERKDASFIFYMLLATLAVISVLVASNAGWQGQIFAGVFAFVFMGVPSIIFFNKVSQSFARRRFEEHELRLRTVTISPEGVAQVDAVSDGFCAWSQFDAVEDDDQFIVFFHTKPNIGFLIPKSAFATPDEAERFKRVSLAYHEDAPRDDEESQDQPQAVETGNPYQPPSAI